MTRHQLALPALLALILTACGAEPLPAEDAKALDAAEEPAAPCGGACGPGTVCELGRCVAVNVGPDASADATDAPRLDVDVAVALDAAPDAPADVASEPACASFTVGNCCGAACTPPPGASSAACSAAGRCVVGACNAGLADCDGNPANGCEVDTRSSAANCGACGAPCAEGRGCAAGACVPCDADGDGVAIPSCGGRDCDDADPRVRPGATEVCNGRDDDCDGAPENGDAAAIVALCRRYTADMITVAWTNDPVCIALGVRPMAPPAHARDTSSCLRCFRPMPGAPIQCRCYGPGGASWVCTNPG